MSDPAATGRVVVTGVGAVTAFGWGAPALWRGLLAGVSAIEEPRRFDVTGQRTRVAAEVPPPDDELNGAPRDGSLADRFAVAAAREAVEQAGLDDDQTEIGLYFGSSTAGMREAEAYYAQWAGHRPGRAPLRLVRSHQINGPGDCAARALGVGGPVMTISSACSSGALAIGEALRAVRSGEVRQALAGGSDSLCALTYAGFNSLRSVDPGPCRPFRADRAGLSLGEGAAVLVLERMDDALARGAEPIAELLGCGASCDAHHMTAPEPGGGGAALAIRRALDDAAIAADDVAFVNAHGTGTPLNDVAEWRALESVFGDRAATLPTTTVKGALGHLLGTAGSIEAVATVLSLREGVVPPTPGDGAIDPEAPVDLVVGRPRPAAPGVAVSTSLAFGGANAALVLGAWSEMSEDEP